MFFFFKQKTAYEMRISDWSSDVCSSDLGVCENSLIARACSTVVPARYSPRKSSPPKNHAAPPGIGVGELPRWKPLPKGSRSCETPGNSSVKDRKRAV